jgi:hypothetical protein
MRKPGIPHFGWALVQTDRNKKNQQRKYYCLGCFVCSTTDCTFVQRPNMPTSQKGVLGAEPPPCKHLCPKHGDLPLVHVKCTGGTSDAFPRTSLAAGSIPCGIITTPIPSTENVLVQHFGNHTHPRPPTKKVSPHALKEFESIVNSHPRQIPRKTTEYRPSGIDTSASGRKRNLEQLDTPSNEIPMGVSFAAKASSRKGQLPKCRGCGKEIERDRPRIRHKWTKKHLEFPKVQQFHVNVACLKEDKTCGLLQKILDED